MKLTSPANADVRKDKEEAILAFRVAKFLRTGDEVSIEKTSRRVGSRRAWRGPHIQRFCTISREQRQMGDQEGELRFSAEA